MAIWVILKSHHGEAELKPSEVRASAEIVRDESRFGNRTFKHFGLIKFLPRHFTPFLMYAKLCIKRSKALLFLTLNL